MLVENFDENICICPLGTDPSDYEPIAVREFVDEFNLIIADEDVNVTVTPVVRLVEIEPRTVANYTAAPSRSPTDQPSSNASLSPTSSPTEAAPEPTPAPTIEPTEEPTMERTAEPTGEPTVAPTDEPTSSPTGLPTASPTPNPSPEPTISPSGIPSTVPSFAPSSGPTIEPTPEPTLNPTTDPTKNPSSQPTTAAPSSLPSISPTNVPTTFVCDQDMITVEAYYYVLYTGNTSAVSDADLDSAFLAADRAMGKTGCSSVVGSASVKRRISRRRRRLQTQTGTTSTVEFLVSSSQLDNTPMYQSISAAESFLGNHNQQQQMQDNSVVGESLCQHFDVSVIAALCLNFPPG
ncbi:ECF subfamily RNA polymerase sigma-24 subunit [Seminavis robusta]|uniref:ECF subfamily RNA polymerase sigma-24 subunit n=1 Tax=Seminavis robusta TaxID=568900 RepID=A0A9N8E2Y0_9STRA|nr:ECF subfamily RNA polymerase sigma-24 subunit [Seminavis robusta]|eukprot:Sro472_g149980.1 ECF subfamily RNA polymerase sigma-24 subunit (350) ;mRNA; f:47727-48850